MKKKTAAMVLAALMAFSMTACGNGSTQKEDDSTAADQETTETTETAKIQLRKTPHQVMKQLSFTGLISVRVMWKLRYGSR